MSDKRQEKLTKGTSRAQFPARAVPESLKVVGYFVVRDCAIIIWKGGGGILKLAK